MLRGGLCISDANACLHSCYLSKLNTEGSQQSNTSKVLTLGQALRYTAPTSTIHKLPSALRLMRHRKTKDLEAQKDEVTCPRPKITDRATSAQAGTHIQGVYSYLGSSRSVLSLPLPSCPCGSLVDTNE